MSPERYPERRATHVSRDHIGQKVAIITTKLMTIVISFSYFLKILQCVYLTLLHVTIYVCQIHLFLIFCGTFFLDKCDRESANSVFKFTSPTNIYLPNLFKMHFSTIIKKENKSTEPSKVFKHLKNITFCVNDITFINVIYDSPQEVSDV